MYYSKQLQAVQKRYSMFDWELLAIYQLIKHFRYFVEGRQFMVFTDNKPLTRALLASSDKYTPKQVRHLDYVSQFTSNICHVHKTQNQLADALSRISANTLATDISNTVDFVEMTAAQTNNAELQRLRSSSSLVFMDMPLPMAEATIVCDVSTGAPQPYVPASYKRTVFDSLHSLSHPGIQATTPGNGSFRVAKHQHRRTNVGTNVYAMSAIEGTASYYGATFANRTRVLTTYI